MVDSDSGNEQDERAIEAAKATFGGGCFWCLEAVFQRIDGVVAVMPGYAGGHLQNPAYEAVCNGSTGHAEVVQITFDPNVVSYAELLGVFWRAHDPTTLNRQGADVGTQYRSVIFCHDAEQWKTAEASRSSVDASDLYENPIVTEIGMLPPFYPAENYHVDYFNRNPSAGYCAFVIAPKLAKLGMGDR